MGFSSKQIRQLRKQPHARHLRTRQTGGRELTYIEGWHVIDEANRIFGFEGWDRESLETRCISAREVQGVFRALYAARVRVTVRAGGISVVREGSGTGEARAPFFAEAHDTALKSAETDATKRALATFGKPFGLALYLRTGQPTKAMALQSEDYGNNDRAPAFPNASSLPIPEREIRGRSSAQSPREAIPIRSRIGSPTPYTSSLAPKESTTQALAQDANVKTAPITQSGEIKREANREQPADPSHQSPSSPSSQLDNTPPKPLPSQAHDPDPLHDDGRTQIDKSQLTHGAERRYRDKKHLQFVAAQPCLICNRKPADAHHIRFAQPRALGRKVSDQFTVPLCRLHHRELHQVGKEQDWWDTHGIEPLSIAGELWSESRLRRLGKPGSSILSRSET
jgi:hypothetical protein